MVNHFTELMVHNVIPNKLIKDLWFFTNGILLELEIIQTKGSTGTALAGNNQIYHFYRLLDRHTRPIIEISQQIKSKFGTSDYEVSSDVVIKIEKVET